MEHQSSDMMDSCINVPEPENFALRLNELYKGEFKCISITKKKWLHRLTPDDSWKPMEEGYILYSRISNELYKQFERILLEIEQETLNMKRRTFIKQEGDTTTAELHEAMAVHTKKINSCKRILKLLKNHTFKNKIMRECAFLFYDSHYKGCDDNKENMSGKIRL